MGSNPTSGRRGFRTEECSRTLGGRERGKKKEKKNKNNNTKTPPQNHHTRARHKTMEPATVRERERERWVVNSQVGVIWGVGCDSDLGRSIATQQQTIGASTDLLTESTPGVRSAPCNLTNTTHSKGTTLNPRLGATECSNMRRGGKQTE